MSRSFIWSTICLCIFLGTAIPPSAHGQDEDLRVTADWLLYEDAENSLYDYLAGQGLDLLDQRTASIAALNSRADWEERQSRVRRLLDETVGPFPEKTPLDADVTRTVNGPGYSVEHLVYHSRPDFPVTASLFVPDDLDEPAPGIVFATGHSQASYDRPLYQQVILNLVKKGFVVLAYDPISQGERVQYLDPRTGESEVGGSTAEHSHPAVQAFLFGSSEARHVVWDGIRAVDYLLSREEVDASRIGVHGLSGGGTQSAYVGAFDPRVDAVASSNYLVGYRSLLKSIGPQDGEQIFYHGLARGLDHPDLFEVRAPKPSMVVATTRDYFNIQGVHDIYGEMQKAFDAFGAREKVELVTDDYEHGYTEKTREGIYDFFQRHLDHPGSSEDLDVEPLGAEEMQVTETGQVQTSKFKGETVFSLNRRSAEQKLARLDSSRRNLSAHLPDAIASAREISGYRSPKYSGEPVFRGRYQREGYVIERYFIEGEGDYIIPYVLMIPDEGSNGKALLHLHPEGKTYGTAPGEALEQYVRQGYVVCAPDLIGIGEMGPGSAGWRFEGVPYQHWFTSVLIGRSIAGIRAGDINRLAQMLQRYPDTHAQRISAVAHGNLSSALLHAAALSGEISSIGLVEPLVSYRSFIMTRLYQAEYTMGAVAGAIPNYDLPDLAAGLSPASLLVLNPANGGGEPAEPPLIENDYAVVRSAYKRAGAPAAFDVRTGVSNTTDAVTDWLE